MTVRTGACGRLLASFAIATLLLSGLQAAPPAAKPSGKPTRDAAKRPEPKPLAETSQKGLQYLVNQQQPDGGWGQGGGWRQDAKSGRVEGVKIKDPSDMGNTCIATLALIRAGSTAKSGPYAANVRQAIEFIVKRIETADQQSLYVSDVRDTQLQRKIGPYIDTFLAALVLSEHKGRTPYDQQDKRLLAALDKTIAKIEHHQKEDGTFAGNAGWATILSQGVCSKALNCARQQGVAVKDETLNRDLAQAVAGLDRTTGEFAGEFAGAGAGGATAAFGRSSRTAGAVLGSRLAGESGVSDAGVEIYKQSAKTSALQQRVISDREAEKRARDTLARKDVSAAEKTKAQADLKLVEENAAANDSAVQGLVKKLDDKQFIAGFGSNGGEEFLSYMNIGETLVVKGGTEWEAWNKSISDNLHRVQNQDGSWSGDHCITGRTFCTATALLTLMSDRAPIPADPQPAEKK